MPEPRESYHHGDLRRQLIELATQAIRESGERGFSLRGAARAAGVDVAAAYRHFKNKEDVLKAVAANAFSDLARRMEREQSAARTSIERFHAVGRAYVSFAVDEPALFRLAFGPRGSGGLAEAPRGTGDKGRDPYEMLMDCLSELTDEGRIRRPLPDAALPAWAAVHGLAYLAVDGNLASETVANATTVVIDTVLRGLTALPDPPG